MATIRIAERVRTNDRDPSVGGGVYPIRDGPALSIERTRSRSRSRDARSRLELRDPEGEEAGLRQDGDFKQKQVRQLLKVNLALL